MTQNTIKSTSNRSRIGIAMLVCLAIAAIAGITLYWVPAAGTLPFYLLLICPLILVLFMIQQCRYGVGKSGPCCHQDETQSKGQ